MTTHYDVAEAIAARLAEEWPERTIYRDVCPVEFEQPSFFLLCGPVAVEREMGLLLFTAKFELEIFDEPDEYYVVSSSRVLETQAQVLALFAGWDFQVGDRYITLEVGGDGGEPGKAFVTFRGQWMDCPEERGPQWPPMDTFDFVMKEKE